MTLARYIFTYIYRPVQRRVLQRRQRLGKGITRQDRRRPLVFITVVALPLIFTMFVAGVWHGAGPQFMAFGLLQGIYLAVNHAWRRYFRNPSSNRKADDAVFQFATHRICVLITFVCSTVSVIFFRGDSLRLSLVLLGSMFGIHGSSALAHPYSEVGARIPVLLLAKVAAGLTIVWTLPNTQQMLTRFRPSLETRAWNDERVPVRMRWAPTTAWSFGVASLMFVCLVHLGDTSTFLYFQF